MKKICPSNLSGMVSSPPSKSILHRELIAGCLSCDTSIIRNVNSFSEDIKATISCLTALGAKIKIKGSNIFCSAGSLFEKKDEVTLDCNESGTTYRFLKEFSRIYKGKINFTGSPSLLARPTPDYKQEENETFIDCSLTTQTLSGLLFSLPLHPQKHIIYVENLKSISYIDLTLQTLERHGIYTQNRHYENFVINPSEYKPVEIEIEGDYSQSAFFMVANLLGANIKIDNLNLFSKQGDKAIINILTFMPKIINASSTPDIIPPLAVLACFNDYDTTFTNIEKLKIKESNRVQSILELNKIGANIKEENGKLIIDGKGKDFKFSSGTVSTFGDHRIAMMFAICSQKLIGEIEIDDEKCVQKSYPEFWDIFKKLGGKAN